MSDNFNSDFQNQNGNSNATSGNDPANEKNNSNFGRDSKQNKKFEYLILFAFLLITAVLYVRRNKNEEESLAQENIQYQNIVCLSPSGAEILSAMGAESLIVARTDFCDYPSRLEAIPSVGGFSGQTLSAETILSYKPDLVYGSKGMHDFLESPLNEAGVKLYLSDASSINAVYEEIAVVGEMTGRSTEAAALVKNMKDSIQKITEKNKEAAKAKVYYEVWNVPYMTAGKNSFISDLIVISGGTNIFDDQLSDYPSVSEETIISRDPEIILLPNLNGVTVEQVKERSGWENISAVKNNKIYLIDSDLYSRPGPRIVDAISDLTKIFYGEN